MGAAGTSSEPRGGGGGGSNVAARLKDFIPVFPNEAFTMRPYAGATPAPYPMQLWQVSGGLVGRFTVEWRVLYEVELQIREKKIEQERSSKKNRMITVTSMPSHAH